MNTEFGLEPFEDTRDERAHQIIIAHLAQASPAEQFSFVQRSNYDGNARALRWLADRSETDRAAILAMYGVMDKTGAFFETWDSNGQNGCF